MSQASARHVISPRLQAKESFSISENAAITFMSQRANITLTNLRRINDEDWIWETSESSNWLPVTSNFEAFLAENKESCLTAEIFRAYECILRNTTKSSEVSHIDWLICFLDSKDPWTTCLVARCLRVILLNSLGRRRIPQSTIKSLELKLLFIAEGWENFYPELDMFTVVSTPSSISLQRLSPPSSTFPLLLESLDSTTSPSQVRFLVLSCRFIALETLLKLHRADRNDFLTRYLQSYPAFLPQTISLVTSLVSQDFARLPAEAIYTCLTALHLLSTIIQECSGFAAQTLSLIGASVSSTPSVILSRVGGLLGSLLNVVSAAYPSSTTPASLDDCDLYVRIINRFCCASLRLIACCTEHALYPHLVATPQVLASLLEIVTSDSTPITIRIAAAHNLEISLERFGPSIEVLFRDLHALEVIPACLFKSLQRGEGEERVVSALFAVLRCPLDSVEDPSQLSGLNLSSYFEPSSSTVSSALLDSVLYCLSIDTCTPSSFSSCCWFLQSLLEADPLIANSFISSGIVSVLLSYFAGTTTISPIFTCSSPSCMQPFCSLISLTYTSFTASTKIEELEEFSPFLDSLVSAVSADAFDCASYFQRHGYGIRGASSFESGTPADQSSVVSFFLSEILSQKKKKERVFELISSNIRGWRQLITEKGNSQHLLGQLAYPCKILRSLLKMVEEDKNLLQVSSSDAALVDDINSIIADTLSLLIFSFSPSEGSSSIVYFSLLSLIHHSSSPTTSHNQAALTHPLLKLIKYICNSNNLATRFLRQQQLPSSSSSCYLKVFAKSLLSWVSMNLAEDIDLVGEGGGAVLKACSMYSLLQYIFPDKHSSTPIHACLSQSVEFISLVKLFFQKLYPLQTHFTTPRSIIFPETEGQVTLCEGFDWVAACDQIALQNKWKQPSSITSEISPGFLLELLFRRSVSPLFSFIICAPSFTFSPESTPPCSFSSSSSLYFPCSFILNEFFNSVMNQTSNSSRVFLLECFLTSSPSSSPCHHLPFIKYFAEYLELNQQSLFSQWVLPATPTNHLESLLSMVLSLAVSPCLLSSTHHQDHIKFLLVCFPTSESDEDSQSASNRENIIVYWIARILFIVSKWLCIPILNSSSSEEPLSNSLRIRLILFLTGFVSFFSSNSSKLLSFSKEEGFVEMNLFFEGLMSVVVVDASASFNMLLLLPDYDDDESPRGIIRRMSVLPLFVRFLVLQLPPFSSLSSSWSSMVNAITYPDKFDSLIPLLLNQLMTNITNDDDHQCVVIRQPLCNFLLKMLGQFQEFRFDSSDYFMLFIKWVKRTYCQRKADECDDSEKLLIFSLMAELWDRSSSSSVRSEEELVLVSECLKELIDRSAASLLLPFLVEPREQAHLKRGRLISSGINSVNSLVLEKVYPGVVDSMLGSRYIKLDSKSIMELLPLILSSLHHKDLFQTDWTNQGLYSFSYSHLSLVYRLIKRVFIQSDSCYRYMVMKGIRVSLASASIEKPLALEQLLHAIQNQLLEFDFPGNLNLEVVSQYISKLSMRVTCDLNNDDEFLLTQIGEDFNSACDMEICSLSRSIWENEGSRVLDLFCTSLAKLSSSLADNSSQVPLISIEGHLHLIHSVVSNFPIHFLDENIPTPSSPATVFLEKLLLDLPLRIIKGGSSSTQLGSSDEAFNSCIFQILKQCMNTSISLVMACFRPSHIFPDLFNRLVCELETISDSRSLMKFELYSFGGMIHLLLRALQQAPSSHLSTKWEMEISEDERNTLYVEAVSVLKRSEKIQSILSKSIVENKNENCMELVEVSLALFESLTSPSLLACTKSFSGKPITTNNDENKSIENANEGSLQQDQASDAFSSSWFSGSSPSASESSSTHHDHSDDDDACDEDDDDMENFGRSEIHPEEAQPETIAEDIDREEEEVLMEDVGPDNFDEEDEEEDGLEDLDIEMLEDDEDDYQSTSSQSGEDQNDARSQDQEGNVDNDDETGRQHSGNMQVEEELSPHGLDEDDDEVDSDDDDDDDSDENDMMGLDDGDGTGEVEDSALLLTGNDLDDEEDEEEDEELDDDGQTRTRGSRRRRVFGAGNDVVRDLGMYQVLVNGASIEELPEDEEEGIAGSRRRRTGQQRVINFEALLSGLSSNRNYDEDDDEGESGVLGRLGRRNAIIGLNNNPSASNNNRRQRVGVSGDGYDGNFLDVKEISEINTSISPSQNLPIPWTFKKFCEQDMKSQKPAKKKKALLEISQFKNILKKSLQTCSPPPKIEEAPPVSSSTDTSTLANDTTSATTTTTPAADTTVITEYPSSVLTIASFFNISPQSLLSLTQIDLSVLAQLPEDVQLDSLAECVRTIEPEILQAHLLSISTNSATRPLSQSGQNFTMDFLMALTPDLRREVLSSIEEDLFNLIPEDMRRDVVQFRRVNPGPTLPATDDDSELDEDNDDDHISSSARIRRGGANNNNASPPVSIVFAGRNGSSRPRRQTSPVTTSSSSQATEFIRNALRRFSEVEEGESSSSPVFSLINTIIQVEKFPEIPKKPENGIVEKFRRICFQLPPNRPVSLKDSAWKFVRSSSSSFYLPKYIDRVSTDEGLCLLSSSSSGSSLYSLVSSALKYIMIQEMVFFRPLLEKVFINLCIDTSTRSLLLESLISTLFASLSSSCPPCKLIELPAFSQHKKKNFQQQGQNPAIATPSSLAESRSVSCGRIFNVLALLVSTVPKSIEWFSTPSSLVSPPLTLTQSRCSSPSPALVSGHVLNIKKRKLSHSDSDSHVPPSKLIRSSISSPILTGSCSSSVVSPVNSLIKFLCSNEPSFLHSSPAHTLYLVSVISLVLTIPNNNTATNDSSSSSVFIKAAQRSVVPSSIGRLCCFLVRDDPDSIKAPLLAREPAELEKASQKIVNLLVSICNSAENKHAKAVVKKEVVVLSTSLCGRMSVVNAPADIIKVLKLLKLSNEIFTPDEFHSEIVEKTQGLLNTFEDLDQQILCKFDSISVFPPSEAQLALNRRRAAERRRARFINVTGGARRAVGDTEDDADREDEQTSRPGEEDISSVSETPATTAVGQVIIPTELLQLVPLIEMFILCFCHGNENSLSSAPLELSAFAEKHRRPINALIKYQPSLLTRHFSSLLKVCPMTVDFDNKRQFFRTKIKSSAPTHNQRSSQLIPPLPIPSANTIRITVRRNEVFMDSYHQLQHRKKDEMRGRINISFVNEEAVDAGGVLREWYSILSREIFNPNYALFMPCSGRPSTFVINPHSEVNPDHLHFFRFCGRILGKAIFDNQRLDCYFTRSFYKSMLGQQVTWHDLENLDPTHHRTLRYILENDLTEAGVYETFSVIEDKFGKQEIFDLKENGRNIDVTEENKEEFVQLVAEFKLISSVKQQLDAFLKGFHELVPKQLLGELFDDKELELLISGLPTIDINDLKANTEYVRYSESSPQIEWFWKVLTDFSPEQKAQFLQFVTGSSQVPLEGFKGLLGMGGPQKFSIHKAFGGDRLPSAHTCFNQLDLPEYDSEDRLRQKLLQAVTEAHQGFGFA